jgi:hypothetical protein
MKKVFTLFCLSALTFYGFSQVAMLKRDEFKSKVSTTDRGAYTKTGENIKKGLQVELGFDYEWTDSPSPLFTRSVMTPLEGRLRLGLSKYVELNFAISNRQVKQDPRDKNSSFSTDRYAYWSPFEIAVRTQFIDSKKKSAADASLYLALSVNTTMRSAFNEDGTSRPYVLIDRPSYVTPEMALFVNHNMGKRMVFGYNLGLRWTGVAIDGPDSAKNPDLVYTIRVLTHVCEKIDFYAEHFNHVRVAHSPNMGINVGARFAATNKLVLDLNGGLGLNTTSSAGFAGAGLSYKLGK